MTSGTTITALCRLKLANGQAPEWVMVMPIPLDGQLVGRSGRRWRLGDAAKVATASMDSSVRPVFDYEHQTDFAPKNGQPAPAAGWIEAMETRDDGIYARVAWTAKAREMIEAGEYRYVSPVFRHTKSGEVLTIDRAALTNNPDLEVRALARRDSEEEGTMDEDEIKALCSALGLKEDAEPAAIVKAAQDQAAALKTAAQAGEAGTTALASMAALVDLNAQAAPEAVATAVAARLKANGQTVPLEQYRALATRLEKLETNSAEKDAKDLVEGALRAGKIVPASRDWALSYCRDDRAGFEAFLAAAPVIVAPGAETTGQPARTKGAALDEAQLALCSQLGLDPEAYKKTLDAEAGADVKETA